MNEFVRKDYSYGIIPVAFRNNQVEVFILRHLGGHWGFPKGHPEENEEPLDTAKRELQEETGLTIKRLLSEELFEENYSFSHEKEIIVKRVQYFLAEVSAQTPIEIESEEAIEGKWIEVNEAPMHLTYEEGKRMCRKVAQLL